MLKVLWKTKKPVVFHNGHWSSFNIALMGKPNQPKGSMSDTRAIAWLGFLDKGKTFELVDEKLAILRKDSVVTIYGEFSDYDGLMCSNMHWKNKIGYTNSTLSDSYDHYYRQMNWERTKPIIGNKKADKKKKSGLNITNKKKVDDLRDDLPKLNPKENGKPFMIIDATFWIAISFFIFVGTLIYFKIPQKINNSLTNQINEMKKEVDEAEKLKIEAKNILSDYENKIDRSKQETKNIINLAKKDSDKIILEKTKKFYETMDNKKRNMEIKISQMKKNALADIKNTSIKISIKTVENLIKNSIDKNKLEKIYSKSLEQAKDALKRTKV